MCTWQRGGMEMRILFLRWQQRQPGAHREVCEFCHCITATVYGGMLGPLLAQGMVCSFVRKGRQARGKRWCSGA